jgi:hypothetical protein
MFTILGAGIGKARWCRKRLWFLDFIYVDALGETDVLTSTKLRRVTSKRAKNNKCEL